MPLRLFNPRFDTLPRTWEPRPEGLGVTVLWTGTREYSRNEFLAMLLMPKEWQRVENLRRTRRERIQRERAAAEGVADQADDNANEDGGDDAPPPAEPPAEPRAEHGGGSDQDRGEGGGEILEGPAAGAGGGGTDEHRKEANEIEQGADDEPGGDAGGQNEDDRGEDHGSHQGDSISTGVPANNEPNASALQERLAGVDIPANNAIPARSHHSHSQSAHSSTPPTNHAAAHPSIPSATPPANVAAHRIEHPYLPPPTLTLAPATESALLSSLPPRYHLLQSTYDWPPSSRSQGISVHETQTYAHHYPPIHAHIYPQIHASTPYPSIHRDQISHNAEYTEYQSRSIDWRTS